MRANVNPNSILDTDDWQAYKPLRRELLDHRIINHSAGRYGLRVGIAVHVSPRYLQSYLDECAWRYNARYEPEAMFKQLLLRSARP